MEVGGCGDIGVFVGVSVGTGVVVGVGVIVGVAVGHVGGSVTMSASNRRYRAQVSILARGL